MPRYALAEAERAMYREKGYVSPATIVGPAHSRGCVTAENLFVSVEHRPLPRTGSHPGLPER